METYVDLVTKLSHQQKVMANEAIDQLHKLDSNFSRGLYPVGNSGGVGSVKRGGVIYSPVQSSPVQSSPVQYKYSTVLLS